jgi:hypothetical protein
MFRQLLVLTALIRHRPRAVWMTLMLYAALPCSTRRID